MTARPEAPQLRPMCWRSPAFAGICSAPASLARGHCYPGCFPAWISRWTVAAPESSEREMSAARFKQNGADCEPNAHTMCTPCAHRVHTVCMLSDDSRLPFGRRCCKARGQGGPAGKSVLPAIPYRYIQKRAAQKRLLASYRPWKLSAASAHMMVGSGYVAGSGFCRRMASRVV